MGRSSEILNTAFDAGSANLLPLPPITEGADESELRDEINRNLLQVLRAALLIGLVANFLFGITDILFEPVHDIWIGVLRWVLVGTLVALWLATHAGWAVRWAVPLSLVALAAGCVQTFGPAAMHGDLNTPMVLSLAFIAAASTAAPWGISGQLAAIIVTSVTAIATIAAATGDLHVAMAAYPTTVAGIVFGASLYGAAVCRRNSVLSVERGLGLLRSTKIVEAREAQIRDQLVQLDTLYRTAPVGLSLLDRQLRFVRVNDTFADMNGVPAAAHIGRTLRELLPALADELEPLYEGVFTTGRPVRDVEVSGTTAKAPGVTRHWRSDYWPVPDAHGGVGAVSCVVQDITTQRHAQQAVAQLNADLERRVRERTAELESANARLGLEIAVRLQAAEALRRNQEQLRDIIDNTTAVIYLKDTNGRYVLINKQYEALFHASRTSIVGRTDYDLFPRDAAEVFRRNDEQVLAADRPISFEENAPQDDGIHTFVSVKFPLHDERGVPYGVCGISTDITPRKQMEAQLQASQTQLSAVIENTNDAIWSVDRTYRIVVVNQVVVRWFREAYGKELRPADPFDGRGPAAESGRWRQLYDRVFAGERLVFEQQYLRDGEMRSYLFSLTPIVAADHISGATVFAKDITELRRAEARAHAHQAELSHMLRLHTIGEMAAGLAHEINQPLAAILNYARGCRNRIVSADTSLEELLPVLEEIAAQAVRGGEVIRRLRPMVEKREPTREAVDLNTVVTEAVHVMEAQTRQQGVTLSIELASNLPAVEMDPIQIEQVIVNLLLNSLEAIQAVANHDRRVTIRTEHPGDHSVEVVVQDTGSGLAPQVCERMFEPFFTVKPSGLGMGLAISRSIVEGHGGRIWAANNPDCGAQVHVVLPSMAARV